MNTAHAAITLKTATTADRLNPTGADGGVFQLSPLQARPAGHSPTHAFELGLLSAQQLGHEPL